MSPRCARPSSSQVPRSRGQRRHAPRPVDRRVDERAGQAGAGAGLPGGFKHLVVIYEENHSFDNLYGGWGTVNGQRVNGRSRATAAHTTQVAPGRHEVLLPARRTTSTSPARRSRPTAPTRRTASPATSRTSRSRSTASSSRPTPPAPRPACSRPTAWRRGARCRAGRLHARHRAPLLPGAVPAQRRPAEPLHDRLRRGRPDPGLLQDAGPADLQVPAPHGRPEVRPRRPLLPGRVRRLVPQPPVADRRPDPPRHQPRGERRRRCGELGAGQQRDGQRPTRSTPRPGPSRTAS